MADSLSLKICMPSDLESLIDSASPMVTILLYATGSTTIATVLLTGVLVMAFSSGLAVFSSATRLSECSIRAFPESTIEHMLTHPSQPGLGLATVVCRGTLE